MPERRRRKSIAERSTEVLSSAKDMRIRHLEELSGFFRSQVPQEWEDASRFLRFVRKKFSGTDLTDSDVSVKTVLKFYKMREQSYNDLYSNLPDYVKKDETRWDLFEEIFATLRSLSTIEEEQKKRTRVA